MTDSQPKVQAFNLFTDESLDLITDGTLNRSEVKTLVYFLSLNNFASDEKLTQLVKTANLIHELALSRSTLYRVIAHLKDLKAIPLRILLLMPPRQSEGYKNYDKLVKDGLHLKFSGHKDFITAVGKIDLLTETEVIQVKRAEFWRISLSQVISTGALFPQHKKRIHLYGDSSQLSKIDRIQQTCEIFDVLVTGEEV